MTYSTLLVDIADGVATITLNRPEKLNCFNRTMVLEFRQLWSEVRTDPHVRVCVLRAAPGRAFERQTVRPAGRQQRRQRRNRPG